MKEYPKIKTVWLRDPENRYRTLLEGQYAKPEFEYLANNEWVFTEKVDGTNIRVMWDGQGKISFGGKTDRAQIPAHLVNALNNLFGVKEMESAFSDTPVCLYGEGYGAKIQKGGGNYRPDQGFVLFDARIDKWWLNRDSLEDIAGRLTLDIVPVIGTGDLPMMVEWARQGFLSEWGEFNAEGIVARPATELLGRDGSRIITKIKLKDFLR